MDQRKAAEEEEKRSSDSEEEAMATWSVFAHPCSLLQYMLRACACLLGLQDSFGGTKPSASTAPHAPADSSQEGEEDKKTNTGFYMLEVTTRVWALAVRRPRPPGNPREGSGGNGGHHH